MRFLTCFFLGFFICITSAGQTLVIDSLTKVLNLGRHDTTEVKVLDLLSDEFARKDITKAKHFNEAALVLSRKLNYKHGISNAYAQYAITYVISGMTDSARYFLQQLKKFAEDNPSLGRTANYNFTAGLVYKNQGNFKEALPYMKEALRLYIQMNQKTATAGQYLNIGNTYTALGEYKNAVDYHLKALRLFEDLGNKRGQSFCNQSIGSDFIKLRQTQQALPYLQKSIRLKEELKDKRGIASAWGGLGDLYRETKDYDKALYYLEKALTIAEEMNLRTEVATTHFEIGLIYAAKKDFPLANAHFNKTKALAKQVGDSAMSKAVDAERVGIQTTISTEAQSEKNLLSSLNTSLEMGRKLTEISSYRHLVDFYEANKNYSKAFLYQKKLQQAMDSAQGIQVQVKIKDLEEQFNSEKKEKEIVLLRKDQLLKATELRRQKTIQYSIVAFGALLAVIGFLVVNRYRVIQKSRQLVEIERVRNAIARDLHDDIGSTLTSINIISRMALKDQPDQTVLANFSRIEDHSRKMMDTMSDIVWSINPSNDTLDKTVVRMKEFSIEIFEPRGIAYEFHESGEMADARMDVNHRKNLFLIFKEVINNAMKYSQCTAIQVSLNVSHENFSLEINDNGIGFNAQSVRLGNGLKNMRERAKLMGANLTIDSVVGTGTKIHLTTAIT
jgi:two-component system, NarL family, sensor histidine kinase UhpB